VPPRQDCVTKEIRRLLHGGETVKDLIRQGKVKHFGLSEAGLTTGKPTRPWLMQSRNSPNKSKRHPHRSHWPGCWRKSLGSFPSRAQPNSIASERTSQPSLSNSRRRTCVRSKALHQKSRFKGRATPTNYKSWWIAERKRMNHDQSNY